jgi:phosphatidylglycerophosphatase A
LRACASPRSKATSSSASPPSRSVTAVQRLALLVATAGGVGYAPVAPGTVASAVTVSALWLAAPSRPALVAFVLAVAAVGTWAGQEAERLLGRKDPGLIVIDEVAGMALAALALPPTAAALLVAFVCFRVFDVVKPYPANALQRLHGGVGVMADDLVAGFYAAAVVLTIHALTGWP